MLEINSKEAFEILVALPVADKTQHLVETVRFLDLSHNDVVAHVGRLVTLDSKLELSVLEHLRKLTLDCIVDDEISKCLNFVLPPKMAISV